MSNDVSLTTLHITDKHHSLPAYWHALKKYHLQHHFADYENGFGVTSRFWDRVFGTDLPAGREGLTAALDPRKE
jgi:sterol desaturase/sphingolipid hydroxylase (fatty acid hydroxylase superfamily)